MEDQNKRAAFKLWFLNEWSEWDKERIASGLKRSTQNDLAEYLGISRQAVSKYVSGERIPEGDMVEKIALKFDFKVYAILELKIPDKFLTPEFAAWMQSAAVQLANTMAATNTDRSSDQARKLAREIASESGLTTNNTEKESP